MKQKQQQQLENTHWFANKQNKQMLDFRVLILKLNKINTNRFCMENMKIL